MKYLKNNREKLLALMIFALALIVSLFVLNNINANLQQLRKHDLDTVLYAQASSFEKSITTALSSAKILALWVRMQDSDITDFKEYSAGILDSVAGINNLQLAPKGVVKHIYPLAGHEQAIGHNILRDDKRITEARLAILSNQLTLAGPFELLQGGVALIGRQPIFIKNGNAVSDNSKENKETFWGFASALIILDDFVAQSTLNQLEKQGFYFNLWRYHPDTGDKMTIATNTNMDDFHGITRNIEVPNSIWHLTIKEINDVEHAPELTTMASVLFLLDLLLSFIAYQFLLSRAQKRTKVS